MLPILYNEKTLVKQLFFISHSTKGVYLQLIVALLHIEENGKIKLHPKSYKKKWNIEKVSNVFGCIAFSERQSCSGESMNLFRERGHGIHFLY